MIDQQSQNIEIARKIAYMIREEQADSCDCAKGFRSAATAALQGYTLSNPAVNSLVLDMARSELSSINDVDGIFSSAKRALQSTLFARDASASAIALEITN